MSLVIDIIIILAAVASVYGGIVRGFVKSASGFVSLILALAAAYMFASPAAEWLDRNVVSERVGAIVSDSITSIVSAGEQKLALADDHIHIVQGNRLRHLQAVDQLDGTVKMPEADISSD